MNSQQPNDNNENTTSLLHGIPHSMPHGGVTISPFAPRYFPKLKPIAGIEARSAALALRYIDRDDLLALTFAEGSVCAALFTRSSAPAAPVIWSRKTLNKNPYPRALLINAGQANAACGLAGTRAMEITRDKLAECSGVKKNEVLIASTGVIGEPLDGEKIARYIPRLLQQKPCGWRAAAQAIATTDSFPKGAGATTYIGGDAIQISAIAKGSGMIAPNMATMLALVATDANLAPELLRELLRKTNEQSFNAISVDGDTSTNDMVLAVASAAQKHQPVTSLDEAQAQNFINSFAQVMQSLAKQIAMDGEGIGKFITVRVINARSQAQARKIGLSVLSSPLVKIAIAYGDPNWGRIVMAIGKSLLKINWQAVTIAFGKNAEHVVFAQGEPQILNEARMQKLAQAMSEPCITIHIDLQAGVAAPTETWGCDLTHENLRINGAYRS